MNEDDLVRKLKQHPFELVQDYLLGARHNNDKIEIELTKMGWTQLEYVEENLNRLNATEEEKKVVLEYFSQNKRAAMECARMI